MTTEQYITLIADELGRGGYHPKYPGVHPLNEKFKALVRLLYSDFHSDKSEKEKLRYYYTRRHAIDSLLGNVWEYTTYQDADVNETLDQWSKHLADLRETTEKELLRLETRKVQGGSARVGEITKVQNISPSATGNQADANDPAYRGDPYKPTRVL